MGNPITLMYVSGAYDDDGGTSISCLEIDGSLGAGFFLSVPYSVGSALKGRHVWVIGGWGDECKIHSWVELPEKPKAKVFD